MFRALAVATALVSFYRMSVPGAGATTTGSPQPAGATAAKADSGRRGTGTPFARRPTPIGSVSVTAFVDVAVVPMDSERVLTGQTVLVQGGRITALGPVDRVPVPADAVRIDGRGKFLIPGLADMHTHLQFVDSPGDEHILLLLLSHGVTTIRNLDFNPDRASHLDDGRLLRLRARAAAGELLSPRIYTSGKWPEDTVARARDAAKAIPAFKAAGYDFVKVHDEDAETLDSVIAAAHRAGLPVVGHVPDELPLERVLKDYTSIEHLMGYPKPVLTSLPQGETDSVALDTVTLPGLPALVEATHRAGVWNCPTQAIAEWMASHNGTINPGVGAWKPHAVLVLRRRIIKALQDGGAGLLLGTDEAVGRSPILFFFEQIQIPNPSVQDELEALVRAGLTPYQALVTGTRNPAAYFGTLHESGTVAVGKRADLVLLDGNPLTDIGQTEHLAGVMLGGRWLPRGELDRRAADTPSMTLGIPK